MEFLDFYVLKVYGSMFVQSIKGVVGYWFNNCCFDVKYLGCVFDYCFVVYILVQGFMRMFQILIFDFIDD